jgi:hypothetical protein
MLGISSARLPKQFAQQFAQQRIDETAKQPDSDYRGYDYFNEDARYYREYVH